MLIPIVNQVKLPCDQELREEMHASSAGNGETRCQVSRRDVLCDSHVEYTQAVFGNIPLNHAGNLQDFSRPDTLIDDHSLSISTFPLDKERTGFQSQNLGNSEDLLCPVVLTNDYSSPLDGVALEKEITNISATREYDISGVPKIVDAVIGTVHDIIKEDLTAFNMTQIT